VDKISTCGLQITSFHWVAEPNWCHEARQNWLKVCESNTILEFFGNTGCVYLEAELRTNYRAGPVLKRLGTPRRREEEDLSGQISRLNRQDG